MIGVTECLDALPRMQQGGGQQLRPWPAGGDVDGRYYAKMTDTAKPDPRSSEFASELAMEGLGKHYRSIRRRAWAP